MYELNRARLYNIGPNGARYDDVLLDLSGGGPPIAAGALIPSPSQLIRRPALATLLVLENGGGKSVFIRMLLSTVLPERQSRRGRDALRAYVVSTTSPSHVVLEWVNVRDGGTLLTGQALAPGADGRVDRLFYSLSPTAGTTLSTLPFAENRRRLTLNSFHDALKRLDRSDTSLNMASETRQGEWEKHLRRLGLEPDLFAVQQAMNVDEGDAAEAFKTTTGRQFVEWLLSKALDTEKYRDLGDTFGAYAKKIGQREQMLLEREFSTAMAEAAQKLATCRAEQVATTTAAQAAATTLGRVASEIQVSVQKSEEELAHYRSELETTKTTLHERQQRRDHADARNKEVIRRTLALRADNASSRAVEIGQSLTDKRAELDAWRLIPKVLEANTAHEKYRVTSELLDQAERAAGAAQLLRDRAGAQLAGALQRAEQRCRQLANELADSEANDKAAAAEADRAASTCEQHAIKNIVTAQHLTAQVEGVQTRVEQAREAGLLENDETVPDADARLLSNAEEGAAKAARLRDAHTHLELETRQLGEAANQLIEPEITSRKAAEEAATAVSKLDTAARELAAEQLVRELAELDHDKGVPGGDAALWIETNAPMLRGHAEAIQASTRDQLDALNADNKTDQRLIDALTVDNDALLPPRETVEHLLQLLSEHGVDATPGWRALEQVVNPRLHGETIQANPALLDGIVVTDETQLVTAQEVLTEARPLPGAAILVTTAESLGNGPAAAGPGFVVEPTPAMHDPTAATELRRDVEARMADRNVTIADLAERHAHALQLRDRLDTWIRDHPAGDVERLRSAAETAAADATDAKAALDAAHEAHTQSVSALDEHVIVLKDAEAAAVDAANIAASMTQLAADLVEADQCRRQITELDEQTNQYRNDAGERRQQAEALRNQATESAVQAESYRRDGAVYAQRLKKVVVGNEVPNADVDDGDLTALEIAYENAVAGFQAVEVGEDLRQRVDTAQSEMSIADAALQDEPTHIVARARLLTGTSEAGNEESREAAKRRLGRAVAALETEHETLTREIGRLQGETIAASPPGETQWTNLDAEWTPSNPDHGATLAERAAVALNDAEAHLAAADGAHQSAAGQLARAQASTREMQLIHGSLKNTVRKLDLPSDVKPFTGTAKDAQHAVDEATRAYAEASERLSEANQGVHEAVAGFRDAANQNRFTELKAPVYKQLTDIDKTALIERSDQWATQLAARAASLTTDLEDSERHRQLLIDQLQHHVGEALALVEKAERLSRLPDIAGKWARRKILKIGFSKPDAHVLAGRIADTLDENARKQAALPGRDLVLRCVGTAVPRDFKVEILKPDSAGRAEYASISDMAKVFSGGQELTGAIMLYCTLAALRSSARSTAGRNRMGGMLILDNPIGKASADYLLTLQINMAAALGVQLIYTTGSMEDRVLATFPLCIRLRNDADQRTGTRHLHVTDRVVGEHLSDDDPVTGQITAARLLIKDQASTIASEPGNVANEEGHNEMADER